MKICLVASSGGHFEQVMMLKPLIEEYSGFVVTEETSYNLSAESINIYYLKQVNRSEIGFPWLMLMNFFKSLKIFLTEKPDIMISTGALATIPMCILAKLFKRKLVFIESFAKVTSPTLTGKLMYKFADEFYVQWEEMLNIYPNAIYKGGLY